jgi:hypothetical protein
MFCVNAGIYGFNREIYVCSLDISAKDVVTHAEWKNLFVMEDIFHNNDATALVLVGFFVQYLVLACIAYLVSSHTYGKLFGTFWTLEY